MRYYKKISLKVRENFFSKGVKKQNLIYNVGKAQSGSVDDLFE